MPRSFLLAPCRARALARGDCSRCTVVAQLEMARHMLVEMADAVELLDQIEGDVRLVRVDGAADGGEIVGDADGQDLVAERLERIATRRIPFCVARAAFR